MSLNWYVLGLKKKSKNFPVYQKALEDIKKKAMASLNVRLNNIAVSKVYPGCA